MSNNIDQQSCSLEIQDYIAIDKMPSFNTFVRRKNHFVLLITSIFLALYMLLPILAFTPFLQQKVFGNITGVWIYSGGLFLMTIIVCLVYVRRSYSFDKNASSVIAEYRQQKLKGD